MKKLDEKMLVESCWAMYIRPRHRIRSCGYNFCPVLTHKTPIYVSDIMSLSAKENDHARSIKEDMDLQEVEFVVYID